MVSHTLTNICKNYLNLVPNLLKYGLGLVLGLPSLLLLYMYPGLLTGILYYLLLTNILIIYSRGQSTHQGGPFRKWYTNLVELKSLLHSST